MTARLVAAARPATCWMLDELRRTRPRCRGQRHPHQLRGGASDAFVRAILQSEALP